MQIGNVNTAVPAENVRGTLLLYGTGHKQDTLLIGQTIQAEVIFTSDEAANVKLSNGPVLRARLAEGVRLAEGDTVWLAVKAKSGDKLVLQVVTGDTDVATRKTPENILSRAGLHPTLLNLSLAEALRETGLSAEVDVIIQAAAILEKFPDVDVNTALFTAVNNIDENYENLMIINSLQRSDFKVSDILIRIFSLLTGQTALKAENASPGQLDGLGEQRLNAQSFFAEVNKPEDAGALKKTMDQLKDQLELLKTSVESSAGKEKSAAAEVDRLLHGIKLFGAINKYSYMQIPVILGGKPSTSELYVFRTKKGIKKTGTDSASFLLALDTENLGHIEALVGIRNECITIKFSLGEIEVADYLRSRTAMLYELISINECRLSGVLFQTEKDPVTPMIALRTAKLEAGNRSLSLRV